MLADLNGDRRPDIYVANDAGFNFVFFNRGGGKLEERAALSGVAGDDTGHYNGSMGTDIGDFDGSGRASIWVTNFQGELPALYLNLGRETFNYQSRAAGVAAIGAHFVGFGTGCVDFDHDGWQDFVILNGHVVQHPVLGSSHRQRAVLFRNVEFQGRRFLKDVSTDAGRFFASPIVGRGLAIGDLDNDGWPDLVACQTNGPLTVLRNQLGTTSKQRWLGVKLQGKNHRDIVGTTAILETSTRKLTRFIKGGGSYLSANDPDLLFGLDETESPGRLTVHWSWGGTSTYEVMAPNRYWELHEDTKGVKETRLAN